MFLTLAAATLLLKTNAISPAFGADVSKPFATEVQEWCKLLATDLKSVQYDQCMSEPWVPGGTSTKSMIIPKIEIHKEGGKRILIIGGIHGDEISSVSLVFKLIALLKKAELDSQLKGYEYWISPLVNPDGYKVRPRTRVNANKVDLNRNFKTSRWDKDALNYWKTKTKSDPRRYPGPSAGSEVETQLIEKWVNEFKPDLIISVHAPYGLIDHDGPVIFPKIKKTPMKVKTLGAYPGSLGQYAGVEKNIPVVTVELQAAQQLPDAKKLEELLEFVLQAKHQQPETIVK